MAFSLTMKYLTIIFLLLFASALSMAQQIQEEPYFAFSTHPITVVSMASYPDSLVLILSIENKSDKGYFCVNKKVYIENINTGIRTFMMKESGLPYCPDVYHFKWKGEQKIFYLTFPPLNQNVRYVNVIEDCKEHCFAVYGLVLDKKMNRDINAAFDAYKMNRTVDALTMFERVVKQYPGYPFGVFYENIIEILLDEKNYAEAGKWYKKLQSSNFPDRKALIGKVRSLKGFENITKN